MSDWKNKEERKCPSCNTPLTKHLGLIGTCEKLQRAINILEMIQQDGSFFISAIELNDMDGEEIKTGIDALLKECDK